MEKETKKKQLFSSGELRIIALSLGVLSLGTAIAWIGFIFFR
ncbi:hypothetical protein BH11PAT1_BH11PAT1_6480 [soil metagenome]